MKFSTTRLTPVAIAVAALVSGQADAAKTGFAVTDIKYVGTERATVITAGDAGAVEGLPGITIEVQSTGYTNTDRVTLAVTGGTVRSGADIGTVTCAKNGLSSGGTDSAMTLTYSATLSSGNNIVLEVGGRNAGPTFDGTTGMTCAIPVNGIKMETQGLRTAQTVALNWTAATAQGTVYDRLANDAAGTIGSVNVLVAAAQTSLVPNDNAGYRDPRNNNLRTSAIGQSSTNGARNRGLDGVIASSGTSFSSNDAAACTSTGYDCLYRDQIRFNLRNESGNATLANNDGLAVTNSTNAVVISAGGTKYVTTITGDFSFLDDDANGCTDQDLTRGSNTATTTSLAFDAVAGTSTAVGTASTLALATDCGSLTHTYTYAAADGRDTSHLIDFTFRGYTAAAVSVGAGVYQGTGSTTNAASSQGRTLSARSFSAQTLWRDSGLTTTYATLTPSAGAWTAAATTGTGTALVPYVPYGAGISRIIYVTSKEAATGVAGTLSFSATSSSGAACASTNFPTVALPVGGVASVAGEIDTGIRACFPTADSGNGKFSVTITATGTGSAPAFEVSSAYNVSGNRNVVINSTNEN